MTKERIVKSKKTPAYAKLAAWLLAGITLVTGGVLLTQQPAKAADVVVYKSPTCGCCKGWVSHLKENGYTVEVHNQRNMNPVKAELGVPRHLQSCHTAKVGEYVIEGHVPADVIARLLKEKPSIKGLAVPGMPMGSPGMEGPREDPYDVVTFQANGKTTVYARRNQ
ncbi:DUF411 domain-containing protein [Candidatus Endoriftia persephone]|jgi:hypothetical protein|uniref:CopG protein n=3 Tax=Gammaproteobacteria TaxID=1236 RepID=G2FG72_9GAMM|nr:DUF411 domain-containing protein [Candidatus Endoriftia persephone]EGV49836.1 CopG family protein [endosymbiont of Riftia pachyptila (vent Ph05)]EGW54145.1 CopG protein [endosymbiont of Tevnia jerichonana (vent Tica)]USF88639.1 DUF411 domain-containing protein [Candidatus Endoriftia persephone]